MLRVIEETKEEFLQLMCDLIECKSYTSEEKPCADYILKWFEDLGVDEVFRDGTGNVCAIIKGEGTGPNLLLNGHMDVVQAGELDTWAPYDPFKAEIDAEGKLHGRGIDDMKGGFAAQMQAMKALKTNYLDKGHKLPGDLIFLAVVQEEPAEMFGMEYFFEYTMKEKGIHADYVMLGEPSDNNLAVGQRGKVELVVKTYGQIAHSSAPEQGRNAIEYMVPILENIFSHTGIDLHADESGITPITVTNIIAKPGGNLSCIPDYCEISIDRRYAPDQNLEELMDEFRVMFKQLECRYPGFKATVEPRVYNETSYTGWNMDVKKYHPAWDTGRDNEFTKLALNALAKVGQTPKTFYWKFGTDGGKTMAECKIPTLGYSGATIPQAHQAKEWVEISEMNKTYEGYFAIICELYGVDIEQFR